MADIDFNQIEEYAGYYADQLILQYKKPKAIETVKAIARAGFINFSNAGKWRNLDDATGDALLAIAELFGIYGFYDGINYQNKYFAFLPYWRKNLVTQYQEGFQDYKNPKEGLFLKYSDFQQNRAFLAELADKDLRGIIRMRALFFSNSLSCASIQDVLDKYYPDSYISETFDPPMLIYHIHKQYKTPFDMLFGSEYILRPPGVAVTYYLNDSPDPPTPPDDEFRPDLVGQSYELLKSQTGLQLKGQAIS